MIESLMIAKMDVHRPAELANGIRSGYAVVYSGLRATPVVPLSLSRNPITNDMLGHPESDYVVFTPGKLGDGTAVACKEGDMVVITIGSNSASYIVSAVTPYPLYDDVYVCLQLKDHKP